MNKWRKQEDEQLHGGHALVEQLGASVLVLLQKGAAVLRPGPPRARAGAGRAGGRTLVPHGLKEGAAAAAAGPAVAQTGLVVALLGGVQQHPVQRVE